MIEARQHSRWSASSAERHAHCAGSLTLEEMQPRGSESRAAAWGTACHSIAEATLRDGGQAVSLIGEIIETENYAFTVDEDMAACAQVYLDYCREKMVEGAIWWIEEPFSFETLAPPFESGGISDFVVYRPDKQELEVVDLKTGKGKLVEVEGNYQERSYALGVMLKHPNLKVMRVRSTIVQPRAPHKDGTIRSETFHVADLIDWTGDLLRSMHRSKEAMLAWLAAGDNQVLRDEWRDTYLKTGKCDFCGAEGSCPALRRDAMAVAGMWFDDIGKAQVRSNDMSENSPAVIERDLENIELLEEWIRARRALAHEMAEQGIEFKNWHLVDKIGHRKLDFRSEDDAVAAIRSRVTVFSDEQLYDRKLKSPAGLERSLGKATVQSKLSDLIIRPVIGTDLVRKSGTIPRTAAKTIAERYFEKET